MWCKLRTCPIYRECDKSKQQWKICVETGFDKTTSAVHEDSEEEQGELGDVSFLDII